jgi:hypothetical protein
MFDAAILMTPCVFTLHGNERGCDDHGANIPSQQSGSTALILAAHHDNSDCVRLLLAAGANKNAKNYVRSMISLTLNFNYFYSGFLVMN